MFVYNTLTKQKEEFIPREYKKVKMFVCGPTVYDFAHLGNARTYIAFGVISRYLEYRGYEVFYLQNITDIDDKIIERARNEGKDPLQLAKEFTEIYLQDMESIKIRKVSKYARATEYIPQIINQVKRLIEKGCAYLIENDGYYFDLKKFPDYGKLSGRTVESAEDAVSRIDESVNKRNKGDFALWKFSKPDEPSWESDLGAGRPGWHIEDTAITETQFGPQYDLHGGARDLIFPHHEAEIAQMESISGFKPFVKYWLHSGFLTVNSQKMSKSSGNFITVRDLLKKVSPEVLRFVILSSHYRSPIDYNQKLLQQSEAAVARIGEFMARVKSIDSAGSGNEEIIKTLSTLKSNFEKEMDDDFNTPKALAVIFETIRSLNILVDNSSVGTKSAKQIISVFEEIDEVLNIIPKEIVKVPDDLAKLVQKRESLREAKDFQEADKIRAQIESLGYHIDDTTYGPLVKRK